MGALPPVSLGAIILGSLAPCLALRPLIVRRAVEPFDIFAQPRRQFAVDAGLVFLAGGLAAAFQALVLGFPFFSGVKLWIGMSALAFFTGMDQAVSRQRAIIDKACTQAWQSPPASARPLARKLAAVALGSALFASLLLTLILTNAVDWLAGHAANPEALKAARRSVTIEVVFITSVLLLAAGVLITRFSENLRRLMAGQTAVLDAVSRGELSRFIPVATADEFGIIAARTNAMIEGLRHRTQLMNALDQAQAIQRSLLPGVIPTRQGLSIAATAIYSGQTGGDYYDFLEMAGDNLSVVVADVSGHGVDSALLMASARGFLRQAALCLSDPSRIVTTLNRHLARDVEGSGHFITLFMLCLDPRNKRLEWVRAGHDPALLYDPATGSFEELAGRGIPLAISQESAYLTNRLDAWPAGRILILGTDGLWEAFGPDGRMYGKERLKDVVAASSRLSAQGVLEAVVADWREYLDGMSQEDDLTLVVVRFDETATPGS